MHALCMHNENPINFRDCSLFGVWSFWDKTDSGHDIVLCGKYNGSHDLILSRNDLYLFGCFDSIFPYCSPSCEARGAGKRHE